MLPHSLSISRVQDARVVYGVTGIRSIDYDAPPASYDEVHLAWMLALSVKSVSIGRV